MIRILPITILFLAAFVAFKSFGNIETIAHEETAPKMAAVSAKNLEQIEPASGAAAQPTKEEAAAEEAAHKPDATGKKDLPQYVSTIRPAENIPALTQSGKELLEQMSARRTELDTWKKDLDLRASLVEASSRKLDDKIARLEHLQAVTQKLLDEYKVEDNSKIKSMVKVYENMKPQDAATVFNQLDMPILLEIVQQMSARRLSAILAKMDSTKAKEVTEKIIANRELTKM